jgi:hypothetical protein
VGLPNSRHSWRTPAPARDAERVRAADPMPNRIDDARLADDPERPGRLHR